MRRAQAVLDGDGQTITPRLRVMRGSPWADAGGSLRSRSVIMAMRRTKRGDRANKNEPTQADEQKCSLVGFDDEAKRSYDAGCEARRPDAGNGGQR